MQTTIERNNYYVLRNEFAETHGFKRTELLLSESDFIEKFKTSQKICTNSENCIEWINKNLDFTELPNLINIFKDKVKFRDLVKHLYPNFFYKQLEFNELNSFDINPINKPIIIKPAVGFLSLGVYKVNSDA
ncbi:MAG TPA: ATP-grasp domain-containing protein, partial [Bacteroidetes bacterium]|nr:ATP-grasp domain-containing protein [Bacteroidota bacterium]